MLADKTFPFVYIITNGTIQIPEEFNHRLFVSIDGLPQTNDSIRGIKVFSRVIENYHKDRRVIINMTLQRKIIVSFKASLESPRKMGLPEWFVMCVQAELTGVPLYG
jgi:hypothetical protein